MLAMTQGQDTVQLGQMLVRAIDILEELGGGLSNSKILRWMNLASRRRKRMDNI